MKVRGGRELWMQMWCPQEMQRDFRLWEEFVPQVHWDGGVNWGESGYKVFFESPDGALCSVASTTVRRNQLISNIMGSEEILQSCWRFVVESLQFRFETFDRELLVNDVIWFDPFRGRPGLHWNDFDVVAILYITQHDIHNMT
jgi:hypothetical protein